MRIRLWSVLSALGLLLLSSLACRPKEAVLELVYLAPYKVGIEAGSELPGAPIRYVGPSSKGAEVIIAGQRAFKQKGDSLDWHGTPIEGVRLDLALRILWFDEEALHVIGKARVAVRGPEPEAALIRTDSPMKYDAPVFYTVPRGDCIPGTQIEYLGKTEEGAKLGGVEGYPYRKLADSILWEGRLREGVFLRLNVRVLFITEDSLRVGGVATIWIAP